MDQLVQAAITAARQGNRPKAIELIKEVLCTNPNDIEAWLVLSRLVDQPERKRQCLNRVLSLDAGNKMAREELLKLDRAAMGVPILQTAAAPAFAENPRPPLSSSISATELPTLPPDAFSAPAASLIPKAELQVKAPLQRSSSIRIERPLVFSYSSSWLILLYLFTALSLIGGCLLLAAQETADSIRCFIPALFCGFFALSVSSKVEVKETSIRTATLLSSSAIKWDDIASIKSDPAKKRLQLISSTGKSVNVSTQLKDYHALIEILRQKRPDLFGEVISSPAPGRPSATGYEQAQSGSTTAFTGAKTFKKSFFRQYGITFVGIFFCLAVVLILASVNLQWDIFTILAILLATAFGIVLVLAPFVQVSAIKVEPNKLTLETFFGGKEVSARQIQEIKIQSVRGRYGQMTNFVNIVLFEGKNYGLSGFSDGEEIIYGFLMNWWNTYRNK